MFSPSCLLALRSHIIGRRHLSLEFARRPCTLGFRICGWSHLLLLGMARSKASNRPKSVLLLNRITNPITLKDAFSVYIFKIVTVSGVYIAMFLK